MGSRKTLFKKVYRAMWAHKRAYIACVFLIAIGIMMFIAMSAASDGLARSVDSFYGERRLADVFARVGAVSAAETERFRGLDGIKDVSFRTVMEVRAEVEGSDEIITLRLISIDPMETNRLNDIEVTGLSPVHGRDMAVNIAFLEAHNLSQHDPVTVYASGRAIDFYICGTAMSPEYAYIAKSLTDMLPDNSGFGIAFITTEGMEQLTGRPGTHNEVNFTLQDGYEFDDVKTALQDALEPYGLISLMPKKDLMSYAFVDLEINALRSVSTSMPFVFIGMAVVVLYLMMKRIIEQERTQIGTLKAFGYSNRDLIQHYLCYGLIVGVIGGIAGFLYGYALSGFYLAMFVEFFALPNLAEHSVSPLYLLLALAVAIAGGLAGAFMGSYQILHTNPAEAMKAEAPKPVKGSGGNNRFLKLVLNSRGFMSLRGIARHPIRSGFVVIGITFSFALLCITGSMSSLMDKLIYGQFTDIRLYNVKVTLNQPAGYDALVESAYGVRHITRAEGLLEIPVVIKNRHLQEGTVLTGVAADSILYGVVDTNTGQRFDPPEDGIIITNGIADTLQVRAGDRLYIASPLLGDDIAVPVTRVIEQNMGSGCYMELAALSALLNQPATATSLILNTDNLSYVREYFKDSQNAATIEDKDSTLEKYLAMMEPYTSIFYVLQIMGGLVAFVIIYNTATISLSERKREYATLRVLGLTVDEVCEIMNFEYWLLSIVGMAFGVPMAMSLGAAVNTMMDTTLFSMPTTLPFSAYVSGVVGCACAIFLSNLSAKKKIRRFDMVEVLKERD